MEYQAGLGYDFTSHKCDAKMTGVQDSGIDMVQSMHSIQQWRQWSGFCNKRALVFQCAAAKYVLVMRQVTITHTP